VRQVAIMTAVGAAAGIIVWVCFSGPIAQALPANWRVAERMAAATLRLDRWEAGAHLMRTTDPEKWNGLAAASQLWIDNRATLEGCARSAARTGKAQRCTVMLGAPIPPNPGRVKD
uniref:DUF6118 family protein n=1 Tax=uncultured Caulobacter sp. TaxID=158749 RepID=UPI0025F6FCF4